MRVLFVTHNFPSAVNATAGFFLLRFAHALKASGVRVQVIAPATDVQQGADTVEGIPVFRVPYARRMSLAYGGAMAETVGSSPRAFLSFLRLIRAFATEIRNAIDEAVREGDPFDVIHCHWWLPAGAALRLLQSRTKRLPPAIVTMHGSDVRLAGKVPLSRYLMRHVLGGCALRTAVSGWLASRASQLSGLDVEVGSMPVNDALFTPDASVGREKSVLFVGRFNRQKGAADVIEAMALPPLEDASLIMVGSGVDEDAVKELAHTLGVDVRTRWCGALPNEDLVALYRRAGVAAMPSREEGLGLVAVEAQLCETPVVAYDSGGVRDVVVPANGGFLVPVGDTGALSATLARVLDDPALRAASGARARLLMLSQFSSGAVAKRYIGWYERLAGQP